MSSIASGMNQEKTNRWLLIGALVLAVAAGVLVFALAANLGGDDDETVTGSGGPNVSLVATRDIDAGTTLSADMFTTAEFSDDLVIANPISDPDAVAGLTTTVDILKGQQVSAAYVTQGTSAEELKEQMAFLIQKGQRAVGVSTDAVTIAGGYVIPGDRVDVIWQWTEKETTQQDFELRHTEMLFQNVEVVARVDSPVDGVVTIDNETGAPSEVTPDDLTVERRNEEVAPEDDADYIVLAMSPEEVLRLISAADLGELTFTLRPFGDTEIRNIPPIIERVIE